MLHKILSTLLLSAVLLAACVPTGAQPDAGQTISPTLPAGEDTPNSSEDPVTGGSDQPAITPQPGVIEVVPTTQPGGDDDPVSSDTPQPGGSGLPGYAIQPGDGQLSRGEVFWEIDQVSLLLLESYPIQVKLQIAGSLPTPCHHLRADVAVDEDKQRVDVTLYSLVDPEVMCTQVLQDFSETISLGSFSGGSYTVYINGKAVGSFDS